MCVAWETICFPLLFQSFPRDRARPGRAPPKPSAGAPRLPNQGFACFPNAFKGFLGNHCRSRDPARAAGGRPPGARRIPRETIVFPMVLQGFQGFRGGSRGGPVGGPRGPGFTGTKELLVSPLVSKDFEVTIAGPGAPSGGRPGGTFRKPMNFHVFWSAGRRAHPPPALEAVWRYQSVAAQSILTDTRRTDASRLTQYPPPTLSICCRCFCSWSH